MRRALVAVVVALALAGVAAASTQDRWGDKGANDVLIPQDGIVEMMTDDEGGSDKPNFKLSFTRPIEVAPGLYCVVIAADVGSDYVGVVPHTECFEIKEKASDAARLAYVKAHGIEQADIDRAIGKAKDAQKKLGG